jgi:signal transduction histidine kinase
VLVALIVALVLAAVAIAALRIRYEKRLSEVTDELERERERGTRLAAAQERVKIGQELHELIATRLRTIVSETKLVVIHRAAEEALGELERAVEIQDEPPAGLAGLPALIERARAAGIPVTLHVEGEPRRLAPGIDVNAYRIVQEALANVHMHAPGAPATVRLAWSRHELALAVRDVGTGGVEARDVASIEARVDALDGELDAGPLPSGGYELRVVLPF